MPCNMQAVETGEAKANGPFAKTFVSAMLAGAYVGLGAMLALSIGGNCPELAASNPGLQKMVFGAFGLPVGLLMVRLLSTTRCHTLSQHKCAVLTWVWSLPTKVACWSCPSIIEG